jgi:hypothetical protein
LLLGPSNPYIVLLARCTSVLSDGARGVCVAQPQPCVFFLCAVSAVLLFCAICKLPGPCLTCAFRKRFANPRHGRRSSREHSCLAQWTGDMPPIFLG